MRVLHRRPNQRTQAIHLLRRHFEKQFVVHLQNHARAQLLLDELTLDSNHRQLDEVSGRALQRRIERRPLGQAAEIALQRNDFRNRPGGGRIKFG